MGHGAAGQRLLQEASGSKKTRGSPRLAQEAREGEANACTKAKHSLRVKIGTKTLGDNA